MSHEAIQHHKQAAEHHDHAARHTTAKPPSTMKTAITKPPPTMPTWRTVTMSKPSITQKRPHHVEAHGQVHA
jgi:hypothetical protein